MTPIGPSCRFRPDLLVAAPRRGSTPYPWVLGEAHAVNVVTSTGTTFSHDIPVAVATPDAGARQLVSQALLGAFVGILPVAIGLMLFPLLRGVGTAGMRFLLALTVGLLAFLFVDSFEEALELAGRAAPLRQGVTLVVLTAVAAIRSVAGSQPSFGESDRRGPGVVDRPRYRSSQSW